ncbi:MAG: metal-dependent transcriptional regulator [Euryarchaeota archaeon]|nr:metal-dependent transcriptional regulator [Euryarchaeota archaeon]
MKISDKAEEILETLWIRTFEENDVFTGLDFLKATKEDAQIEELLKLGFITLSNNQVKLTETGKKEAENVLRRHRLAERLLVDVLDVKGKLIHDAACKFEHLLHRGIDENICILLGHPKFCPHGNPIPPGKCCLDDKESAIKVVSPLSDLNPGQRGKIAYIHTRDDKKLQKLMALGVLPGMSISLIQRFPSYVFQIGQTQIAVDKEIADDIHVLLTR